MEDKRNTARFDINPIEIHGMISIQDLKPICDYGYITEASSTGFKLIIRHDDFCVTEDGANISPDSIQGSEISLYIPAMELDITGCVARTKYLNAKEYEVGIDYTQDAPDYWRECLCDLLPRKAG